MRWFLCLAGHPALTSICRDRSVLQMNIKSKPKHRKYAPNDISVVWQHLFELRLDLTDTMMMAFDAWQAGFKRELTDWRAGGSEPDWKSHRAEINEVCRDDGMPPLFNANLNGDQPQYFDENGIRVDVNGLPVASDHRTTGSFAQTAKTGASSSDSCTSPEVNPDQLQFGFAGQMSRQS